MIFLPWSFNGPLSDEIKTAIAVLIVLVAAAIILPTYKKRSSWSLFFWLLLAAGFVASVLLFGSFTEILKIWTSKAVGMTKKVVGIIRQGTYGTRKN